MGVEVIIDILCGLLPLLGTVFLITPRVGLSVFGLYAGDKTQPGELKIARIVGGVALLIGLVLNFVL